MKKVTLTFSMILIASFYWFNLVVAQGVQVGDAAPAFNLKSVSGEMVSLPSDTKGSIVIFTCNHCPYSKKYEDRIIELHNNFADKGYPVVAINSNDPVAYPSDSYKNMKIRAKEKGFPFEYIFDETQEVAKAYGAKRTPEVYLVKNTNGNSTIEYTGAIDDNANASGVETRYLEDAINAMDKGEKIATTATKAVGCTIKWKK